MRIEAFGWRAWLVAGLSAAVIVAVILTPAIPQPLAYHDFADARRFFGVPNFLNVVSNVPFVLAGAYGLALSSGAGRATFIDDRERTPYRVFFWGAVLTAFGSAWYHAAPDNGRLVWDRLPMTLGFAGLASAVLEERLGPGWGRRALWPLVLIGVATVFFWRATEAVGRGNVLPYAAYQLWTIAVVVLAILACPARRYSHGAALWWIVALYAAAKLSEAFDPVIQGFGNIVSGHTLKHLLAAGAVLAMAEILRRRTALTFAAGSVPRRASGAHAGGQA